MTRTAILLPYPAQQEQIVQISGVYGSLDIMCVERAYTETVAQLGKKLELKGCELVIARGVHAQLLRDNVTIPLVEMKVTTQEMGVVICRLKSRLEEEKPTIGLVGYGNMFENTDHYDELFGIHLQKYLVSERSELAASVGFAIQEGRRIIEMDTELHKELYQRGFIANFTLDKFYTNRKETKKLEQDVRKIARYSAPVLIMGEFRQDLYFALSALSMEIPPIRHQKEYALHWFNYYIDHWQRQYKRYVNTTQGALKFIQEYEWPGNLEQMSSVCERIILLTEQRNIDEVFIRKQIEQILPDIIPGTEKVVLYKDKEAVKIAELLRKYKGNREKVTGPRPLSPLACL